MVDANEINNVIARSISTLKIPYLSMDIPTIVPNNELFIIVQITPDATADNTKQIPVIISASIINILKMSVPLAPIALKIPVSFVLEAIETDIKLNSINEANIANTSVVIEKTTFIILMVDDIDSL